MCACILSILAEQTLYLSDYTCCHLSYFYRLSSHPSRCSDTHAFPPGTAHSASSTTTRQVEECFLEMDSVLDDLSAAPSTTGMAEEASAASDAASSTILRLFQEFNSGRSCRRCLAQKASALISIPCDWHIDEFLDDKSPPLASVMGSSLFTDLDNEIHLLAPGADLSIFAYDEAPLSSSPFVNASRYTYDDLNDKSRSLWTTMDPFLFAFGEVHHFLSPAADPSLFHLDEPRHMPLLQRRVRPCLPTLTT